MMEIFAEIHQDLPRESPGGIEYTRKALEMIPCLPSELKILDIGCGPGQQTLELAKLTKGQIIAIDNHQPYLDSLKAKAIDEEVSGRITCLNQTMFKLPFTRETFDLIWAEGSIYIIGFIEGLEQWYSLLKPGGYLVVSDLVWLQSEQPEEIKDFWEEQYPDMKTIEEIVELIPEYGYRLIGNFTLPQEAWWNYYLPLEARINVLFSIYENKSTALEVLENELLEIEMYRQYHNWYGYGFFVLEKI